MANLSNTAANTEAAALAPLMNSGFIELYAGPQPANANTPLLGNTLIATLQFSNPAFGVPLAGTVVSNPIASAPAIAPGLATFARVYQSDAATVVMDISVGVAGSGAEWILNTTSITAGANIACSPYTHTVTEI